MENRRLSLPHGHSYHVERYMYNTNPFGSIWQIFACTIFSSATNHPKTTMSFGQKKGAGILKILKVEIQGETKI
jgi:hypothetical protein